MLRYLLRRVCNYLLVLWGVATLIFLLFHVCPAGSAAGHRGESATVKTDAFQPSRPLWICYGIYLNDLSPIGITCTGKKAEAPPGLHLTRLGDSSYLALKLPALGRSSFTTRTVSGMLGERLPGTISLLLSAVLLAAILGTGLGLLAALKKGTAWDTSAIAASIVGLSAPAFFVGLLISGYLLSGHAGLRFTDSRYAHDVFISHRPVPGSLILPAIALSIRPMAIITQHVRSAMLDVLQQDYIQAARAMGLSRSRILLRHALPNALNPLLTAISGWLAELLAGTFFIEAIFGRNGIGRLTAAALAQSDFPLVTGAMLLTALLFISINLLADVLAAVVDPRLRLN